MAFGGRRYMLFKLKFSYMHTMLDSLIGLNYVITLLDLCIFLCFTFSMKDM